MNIILTGPKHCGKSTIIKKLLEKFDGTVSGFISEFDRRDSDTRELLIKNIQGSVSRCCARWEAGTVEIFPDVFDNFAASLIDTEKDIVLIDELGKFEKHCDYLRNAVEAAFESPCPVIASLRLDAAGWMQELKNRNDTMLISVTSDNRDSLPVEILRLLQNNCKL